MEFYVHRGLDLPPLSCSAPRNPRWGEAEAGQDAGGKGGVPTRKGASGSPDASPKGPRTQSSTRVCDSELSGRSPSDPTVFQARPVLQNDGRADLSSLLGASCISSPAMTAPGHTIYCCNDRLSPQASLCPPQGASGQGPEAPRPLLLCLAPSPRPGPGTGCGQRGGMLGPLGTQEAGGLASGSDPASESSAPAGPGILSTAAWTARRPSPGQPQPRPRRGQLLRGRGQAPREGNRVRGAPAGAHTALNSCVQRKQNSSAAT